MRNVSEGVSLKPVGMKIDNHLYTSGKHAMATLKPRSARQAVINIRGRNKILLSPCRTPHTMLGLEYYRMLRVRKICDSYRHVHPKSRPETRSNSTRTACLLLYLGRTEPEPKTSAPPIPLALNSQAVFLSLSFWRGRRG